eukprot:738934-Alexandrium_andersonii.AAC.1
MGLLKVLAVSGHLLAVPTQGMYSAPSIRPIFTLLVIRRRWKMPALAVLNLPGWVCLLLAFAYASALASLLAPVLSPVLLFLLVDMSESTPLRLCLCPCACH